MKRALKSPWTWVVAALALFSLWRLTAGPRGALMAHIDHARGHYEVQGYGLPPPWLPEYSDLLWQKYGMRENEVAGCCVTNELVSYAEGYNAMSTRLLNKEYGKDIFAECQALAERRWQAQQGVAHERFRALCACPENTERGRVAEVGPPCADVPGVERAGQ